MKIIKEFRIEEWGHFIEQDGGGKIGISKLGDISIDEGIGKGCLHGAFIPWGDYSFDFEIIEIEGDATEVF